MIGNDLVDLATAAKESNWRRKGYLGKIFTDSEQSYIKNSVLQETAVWVLWSMKEAAYKIWNRKSGIRSFNPKSFQCDVARMNQSAASGTIRVGGTFYLSDTQINSEFVHTVCRIADCRKPLFVTIVKHESDIERRNDLTRDMNGILRVAGVPGALISKSHHGGYCSYLSTFKMI
ncbi:phosphopantetheinyl transferase [Flavobacterium magnum]|uniref:Phosphopantetheinyl transferase n=1 Tax=Flavobacterium magnum TaxID=2162713 RepID=A0A2S0RG28_9FLAO|nr:4'-phosphopantetheinyl transferase superfamily protein [Flavobacterium magnum]AWA30616.1 phosphopantetheinyl transferase [Flavobacterium magnum]